MYYELLERREEKGLKGSVALCRIEELAPFPWKEVAHALQTYTALEEGRLDIAWVQEEPKNQGAWLHVAVRLNQLMRERGLGSVTYIGRKESPVPATGIGKLARAEKVEVLDKAFEFS